MLLLNQKLESSGPQGCSGCRVWRNLDFKDMAGEGVGLLPKLLNPKTLNPKTLNPLLPKP